MTAGKLTSNASQDKLLRLMISLVNNREEYDFKFDSSLQQQVDAVTALLSADSLVLHDELKKKEMDDFYLRLRNEFLNCLRAHHFSEPEKTSNVNQERREEVGEKCDFLSTRIKFNLRTQFSH